MTVPSERDAVRSSFVDWFEDQRGDDGIARPAFFQVWQAGWRAALEAQHTRDEEARRPGDETARLMGRGFRDYLVANEFDGSADGRLETEIGSLLDDLEEDFVDFMLNRARAYVEQSDQGENDAGTVAQPTKPAGGAL